MPLSATETILIQPLASMFPSSTFVTEQNCVSFNLSLNATGGSFTITMLKDSVLPLPKENTLLSLPFGRYGVVKQVGSGWSTGGMVDTISGQALPVAATLVNAIGLAGGQSASLAVIASTLAFGSGAFVGLGNQGAGNGLIWETISPFIQNFAYRGIALAGIQQVASVVLGEVFVKSTGIHVVNPGASPTDANTFSVQKSDIVTASQTIDYSLDVAAVLTPALTNIQLNLEGDFVYDDKHAQKQPKFTVQAGAPQLAGGADFIPIPDGWLIDGAYEEWQPQSVTDATNPNSTVGGRYWKVFPSPADPSMMRGITQFTRLIKELKIPGNISTFIGSPITGLTKQGTSKEFVFDSEGTQSGIYGFNTKSTIVADAISNQILELDAALVLTPPGGGASGEARSNFYSITMEYWMFPRVNPQTFPVGNPANPFGIPSNVVVISPNSNVLNGFGSGYYSTYVRNYNLVNSPRLKTQATVVFRNTLPQLGDKLIVNGLTYPTCGRISNLNINFGRNGITIGITAEVYQFSHGLWNTGGGGAFVGGF